MILLLGQPNFIIFFPWISNVVIAPLSLENVPTGLFSGDVTSVKEHNLN